MMEALEGIFLAVSSGVAVFALVTYFRSQKSGETIQRNDG